MRIKFTLWGFPVTTGKVCRNDDRACVSSVQSRRSNMRNYV